MPLPNTSIFQFYEGTNPALYTLLTGENLNEPLSQLLANDVYLNDRVDLSLSAPYAGIVYKPTELYAQDEVVYYNKFFYRRNATASPTPVLPTDPTYWYGPFIVDTAKGVVVVNTAEDLPAMSGGKITLATNTTYLYTANISVSYPVVFTSGSRIQGVNRFTAIHTYTGVGGNCFEYTSGSISIVELGIAAGTGAVITATGAGSESFVFNNVYVISCATVGTLTNIRAVIFRSFSVTAATSGGLTFSGTFTEFAMDNSTWSGFTTGTMLNLSTAVFSRIQISVGNRLNVPVGVTGISGLVNSGNIAVGGFGIIANTIFQGAGTYLNNITDTDLLWNLQNNYGVADSSKVAQGYIVGSILTTTFAAVNTPVKVNVGTAFISAIGKQFTVSNNGRITYIGKRPFDFHVSCRMFASITGGSAKRYRFYIAKGSGAGSPSVIAASVATTEFTGSKPGNAGCYSSVTMAENDFVEVWCEQITTGLQPVTVDTLTVNVTEA